MWRTTCQQKASICSYQAMSEAPDPDITVAAKTSTGLTCYIYQSSSKCNRWMARSLNPYGKGILQSAQELEVLHQVAL